jgi:hypothetical protein
MAADGSLWIGYTALDQRRQPVEAVDILDPVRARLVKSIEGFSMLDLVNENTRVIRRADVYGLPEVIVERIELDRRRDDGQRQPVPPRAP